MKRYIQQIVLIVAFLSGMLAQGQDSGVLETKTSKVTTTEIRSIKPLRIGAKMGVPTIITANIEYVTPLLDNRVSLMLDYLPLRPTIDDVSIDYTNFEIGANIYLKPTGKGLYAGISYASFDAEGTYGEVEFGDEFGEGIGTIKYNTFNLKIGSKLGRVVFYRMEVGYGFGDIPEFIVVNSVDMPGVSTLEEIPEIPGIGSSGQIYFNFGIGFGFL